MVTTSSSQGKQTYLQLDQANFKENVVSSFLAADIPLHKLNHPALKSLFAAMGKSLPSETAARASVAQLASQKEENIRELLRDKKVFLIMGEAEVAKQKYINVLVGSLDTPNETLFIECLPLDSSSNVNSSIILHTVDDVHIEVVKWPARLARKRAFRVRRLLAPLSMMHIFHNIKK